ncbi:MAG: hypothetical protein ABEJ60_00760 [Halodesulfurarchaeum sp.]
MTERERTEELAPHVEIVREKLESQPFMTQDDLIEETRLPFLAVRDATETLKERNRLEEIIYSHGRLRLYRLRSPEEQAAEQQAASTA